MSSETFGEITLERILARGEPNAGSEEGGSK